MKRGARKGTNNGRGLSDHLAKMDLGERLEALLSICRVLRRAKFRYNKRTAPEHWPLAFRREVRRRRAA